MSDRDAKLKIGVDASEMGKAAEDTKKLRTEIEKVGDAGDSASSGLNKAAGSLEKVETAGEGVAETSREAAGALSEVGESASSASLAAVSGASRAEAAIAGVTDAAGEEARAHAAAGASAVDSSAEATAAIDRVTAAEDDAAASARKLADETERAAAEAKGFEEGIRQIEEIAEGLRKSGLNAEVQKRALSEMIGELDKLVAKQVESGAGGQQSANVAGQALIGLKAKLADVNAEIAEEVTRLRTVGDEATASYGQAEAAVLDFGATAEKAQSRINQSWQSYQDNLTITPGQLRLTAQAVKATELAIVQAGERGQAVTLEQLALYEALENQLRQLTAQANALSNSSRDNAVGLKQTGAQVAGLSSGVQQLTAMLGPNAAKIGMVVGNVGQLGNVMEGLDASVKALDLNTARLTGTTVQMATQYGLVAVVAAAAIAAGVKLSSTNAQNAEVTEDLWQWTKKLAKDISGDFKDSLSGWQSALQSIFIATNDVTLNAAELNTTQEESERTTRELGHAFNELALSLLSGQSGIKLYNIALRDGLKEAQARKLAIADNAEVMKFYTDSLKAGGQGLALWRAALRESQGDDAKMLEFIKRNNDQMQLSIKLTATATEREREHAAAVRAGIDIAAQKGDVAAKLSAAEEQNLARVSAARRELEQATNGTTATLNQELALVQTMIGDSARHAEALRDSAAAISEVAANVDNLSPKQRERLETMAEMISRGEELTESDQRYVASLAAAIIANDKSVISLKARTEAATALKDVTDSLAAAVQAEATAHGESESAIHRTISAAEKLLASNTPLEASERIRLSTIVELGKQVRDLVAAQDHLNASVQAGAAAQSEAGQVEAELYVAKSGNVDWLQREIDVRAEIIRSLATEKTSTDALADSSEKAQAVQKVAHGVYTNVIADQEKSASATKAAGDAAEKTAGQFGDVLVKRLADGRVVIVNVGDSVGDMSDRMSSLGNRAEKAGPAVKKAFEEVAIVASSVDSAIDKMKQLETLFESLEARSARIATNVRNMGDEIEAAGDKASKASGGSITYNNVTEGA